MFYLADSVGIIRRLLTLHWPSVLFTSRRIGWHGLPLCFRDVVLLARLWHLTGRCMCGICSCRFVKTQLPFEKESKREKPPNLSPDYIWGSKVCFSIRSAYINIDALVTCFAFYACLYVPVCQWNRAVQLSLLLYISAVVDHFVCYDMI